MSSPNWRNSSTSAAVKRTDFSDLITSWRSLSMSSQGLALQPYCRPAWVSTGCYQTSSRFQLVARTRAGGGYPTARDLHGDRHPSDVTAQHVFGDELEIEADEESGKPDASEKRARLDGRSYRGTARVSMGQPEKHSERQIKGNGEANCRSNQRAEYEYRDDVDQVHGFYARLRQGLYTAHEEGNAECRDRGVRMSRLLTQENSECNKGHHILECRQRMEDARIEIAHS